MLEMIRAVVADIRMARWPGPVIAFGKPLQLLAHRRMNQDNDTFVTVFSVVEVASTLAGKHVTTRGHGFRDRSKVLHADVGDRVKDFSRA